MQHYYAVYVTLTVSDAKHILVGPPPTPHTSFSLSLSLPSHLHPIPFQRLLSAIGAISPPPFSSSLLLHGLAAAGGGGDCSQNVALLGLLGCQRRRSEMMLFIYSPGCCSFFSRFFRGGETLNWNAGNSCEDLSFFPPPRRLWRTGGKERLFVGGGGIGTISDANGRYRRRREPEKCILSVWVTARRDGLSHKHICSVAQKWRMERGHDDSGGGGTGERVAAICPPPPPPPPSPPPPRYLVAAAGGGRR